MEPYLYAEAGLHPWEVRRYTLRELGQRLEGLARKDDRLLFRLALLACWLINPTLGKRARKLRPEMLVGRRMYTGRHDGT
ncbi:hypothetical protein [Luteitalea sp.]